MSQYSQQVPKIQDNSKSKVLTIESDNSIDYDELKKSLELERYDSSGNSKSSISFNNISTIMKKNPNITIKTVIEHYSDLTNPNMTRLEKKDPQE